MLDIITVCGNGIGSSLMLKMKIEEILTAQQDADQYQEKPSQLTTYVHSTIGSDLCSYIK